MSYRQRSMQPPTDHRTLLLYVLSFSTPYSAAPGRYTSVLPVFGNCRFAEYGYFGFVNYSNSPVDEAQFYSCGVDSQTNLARCLRGNTNTTNSCSQVRKSCEYVRRKATVSRGFDQFFFAELERAALLRMCARILPLFQLVQRMSGSPRCS